MWVLKSVDANASIAVQIVPGKVYTCGRKGTDINIPNDSSVSRKHCTVQLTSNGKKLLVKDSSKYGTFFAKDVKTGTDVHKLEYTRLNPEVELSGKDVLRIGVLKSAFFVQASETEHLVIVYSKLSRSAQVELEKHVKELNGQLVHTWSNNVTHLAMKELVLNVKVTQALASNTPIVTCEFFKALAATTHQSSFNLPVCDDFVPEIADEGLNKDECSFAQNQNRSKLFAGKTFVFLSEVQSNRLGNTCALAGAFVLLANDPKFSLPAILNDSTIVVGLSAETNGILKDTLFEKLQEAMIEACSRFIQEFEIGLALLYCSTDMYCNPKFDLPPDGTFTSATLSQHPGASVSTLQNVTASKTAQSLSMSRIPETVDVDMTETDVIPQTKPVEETNVQMRSGKRGLDSTDIRASKVLKSSGDDQDGLLDLNQTRKRPKPAPKRKHKINKSADIRKDRTTKSNTNIQIENPKKTESSDDEWENLPDSCIDDDSLWTDTTSTAQNLKAYDDKNDLSSPKLESVSGDVKPKQQHTVTEIPQTPLEMQDSHSMSHVVKQEAVDDSRFTLQKTKPVASTVNSEIAGWANTQTCIKSEGSALDTDLPYKDLINVVHVSLVVGPRKKKHSSVNDASTSRNFKKFKKVLPTYYNSGSQTNTAESIEPPKIIGGRDLFKHNNRIENDHVIDDWAFPQSQTDSQPSQDSSNPFRHLKK